MKNRKSKSTWSAKPATDEWNTATNWDPSGVPTKTAIFSKSSGTAITFSPTNGAIVDTVEFASDAPPFNFTFGTSPTSPALTIAGKGIINHSRKTQSFIVASTGVSYKIPRLKFTNKATAGGDDMSYSAGPESLQDGYGGGIIGFCNKATAGSALFTVRTGAMPPPKKNSTVGAEVSFSDNSSAGTARFTIYGTLGTDGDTFGNTVFHDKSTADHATFTNVGGTVSGGDGGNTQFYGNSNAAYGVFNNYGGTFKGANGGDVAFDGNASGGHGQFHNRVAMVDGAFGGVTSFNNNPPSMKALGASAGNGFYHNYGANKKGQGGGGHTEFTAKYGLATAGKGNFINYGSLIAGKSTAGHTIFSINLPTKYYPTAGHGIFWNHPAVAKGAASGFTSFAIYGKGKVGRNVPTAGDGTFFNQGGHTSGAAGGYTSFAGTSSAGNSKLIANGGTHGGYGGRIVFYDQSTGGKASIQLSGNGELDISNHTNGLTIGTLELNGGIIAIQLGSKVTGLKVSGKLILKSSHVTFSFINENNGGFKPGTSYTILTAPNLSRFKADQFSGNSLNGVKPSFTIVKNILKVTFK